MSKTEQITCPVCGKQHIVKQGTKPKGMCLDMVPKQDIANTIDAYTVCDCGMLCFNNAHQLPTPEKLIALPRYKQVLTQCSDKIEQKWALMTYGLQYQWAPMYAAHYYAQIGNTEKYNQWLNIALQRAQDGYDYSAQTADAAAFDVLKVKRRFFDTRFLYTLQHKYIELYRQLKQFDKALQICNALEQTNISNQERKFLEYEKRLIAAENSDIQ